ncbi:TonB-dependent receptor domain-containing protein, partial [Bacteroidota bacterium]
DVRFIGYSNKSVREISIQAGQSRVDLGNIELRKSTKSIDEVEIVAQQAAVEYKIDKKVISVGQQISAAGGSAVDVLETAPGVRTDVNGDVLLRGSSSFTVLIDGKPQPLSGNDALRQVPASAIQSIELITNPSVEYEPDGTAGIINIVTKKNRQAGVSGVANASLHTSGEYRASLNLNRRFERVNIHGGVSANHRPTPYDWYREKQITRGDTSFNSIGDGEWIWGFGGQNLNLGADYEINGKNSISATANIGHMRFSYDNAADYRDFTDPASQELFYREDNSFYVDARYFGFNLNYIHSFDDKGHKITFNSNISKRYALTGNESYNILTDSQWNPTVNQPARQRGVTDKDLLQPQNKIDYVKPFGQNSTLKAGYQGRHLLSPEDYRWETYDPDNGEWVSDPAKSSKNDFAINIHGLYLMFQNNNKIVNWQAGIRTEYTDRLIESGVDNEKYAVNRLDWYPSLNLSRKFRGDHQLQASLSRRVQRPRQWQLWPKQTYVDPTTVWQGNPLLDPEFTNAAELNYMKEFGNTFFTVETYYRQSDNEITWVYEVTDDNITKQTFANLQNSVSVGSEVLANVEILKWWTVVGSVDFFRRQVDSRNIGTELRTANSWNGQFDNSFKLKTNTRIQVSMRYYGESLRAQGSRDAYWMTNLGIRQDLLKRKLILTLTVKDLFSTVNYNDTAFGPNQTIMTRQQLRGPIVGLSLSYALNSYKQRDSDIDLDVGEGGF